MEVLETSGKATITVPANLEISAPNGRIEIKSGKGISLRSPVIRIAGVVLDMLARTSRERFGRVSTWVKDGVRLQAGRVRTIVASDYRVSAGKIVERAKGPVRIDGQKIGLG